MEIYLLILIWISAGAFIFAGIVYFFQRRKLKKLLTRNEVKSVEKKENVLSDLERRIKQDMGYGDIQVRTVFGVWQGIKLGLGFGAGMFLWALIMSALFLLIGGAVIESLFGDFLQQMSNPFLIP